MLTITATSLLSLIGLVAAVPTPVELAPRCGTTVYPTFLQQLKETSPYLVSPNDPTFHVSQTSSNVGRTYQLAAFEGIPAGSYGCQLGVSFPSGYTIPKAGSPTLNVTTLYKESPASIVYPNDYSWSKFFAPASPALGQGLFGTVNLEAPQKTAINSGACPVGGGDLAFIFSIASWVYGPASVEFEQANGYGGLYLTYNC